MGNNYYKWSHRQRTYLKAQDRKNKMMEYLYAYDNKLTENPGIYFLQEKINLTKMAKSKNMLM